MTKLEELLEWMDDAEYAPSYGELRRKVKDLITEEQQFKSVDLADVVCWADMTEETPNLGDLILVRFPPEQRTRPIIIEFDELFEWIDGTQYIRL